MDITHQLWPEENANLFFLLNLEESSIVSIYLPVLGSCVSHMGLRKPKVNDALGEWMPCS